jgi:hypothetical protein
MADPGFSSYYIFFLSFAGSRSLRMIGLDENRPGLKGPVSPFLPHSVCYSGSAINGTHSAE